MAKWTKNGKAWEIQGPPGLSAYVKPKRRGYLWAVYAGPFESKGRRDSEADALAAAEREMRLIRLAAIGVVDVLTEALEEG